MLHKLFKKIQTEADKKTFLPTFRLGQQNKSSKIIKVLDERFFLQESLCFQTINYFLLFETS